MVRPLGLGVLEPIDIANGAIFDVSRRATQRVLLDMARAGLFAYVHLGTPCTVWPLARRGLTNHVKARQREQLGIEFAFFYQRYVSNSVATGQLLERRKPS